MLWECQRTFRTFPGQVEARASFKHTAKMATTNKRLLLSSGNRKLKIPAEGKVQMFYVRCLQNPLETKEKEEIPLVYAQQEKGLIMSVG